MKPHEVPIPPRLAARPRDQRGFVVPWIVLRDKAGEPQFAINDERLRQIAFAGDRCHICGEPLLRGRWFVGGPASALHSRGAFADGGMHDECAHYALAVCPWLAAPKYARRIDDKRMRPEARPDGLTTIDRTMFPNRPRTFLAIMAIGQSLVGSPPLVSYVRPKRPYRKVEFWRQGERLTEEEGAALAAADLTELGLAEDILDG